LAIAEYLYSLLALPWFNDAVAFVGELFLLQSNLEKKLEK
jgi:hypothetical protein